MDINVAALKLRVIEEYSKQIEHLRNEAAKPGTYDYAESCNQRASLLLGKMSEIFIDSDKENK